MMSADAKGREMRTPARVTRGGHTKGEGAPASDTREGDTENKGDGRRSPGRGTKAEDSRSRSGGRSGRPIATRGRETPSRTETLKRHARGGHKGVGRHRPRA